MPNAINPNDYNIDSLNTGFLGPILTTDFRDYVLGHNLQDINPQVVSGGYNLGGLNVYAGDLHQPTENVQDLPDVVTMSNTPIGFLNNVSPYESNQIMNLHHGYNPYSYTIGQDTILTAPSQGQTIYNVQTKTLGDPGNTGSWKTNSGSEETAKNVREKMIQRRAQFSKNAYGPDYIYAYNCPTVPPEETGFVQYKTFAGGDFRSTILGQQLGFGTGAGIEYESDLSDIGKDQRKFNIKERIKLNFAADTLGKINADPFGLLIGQDLITRDYTITRPPGFGGKAAAFTASLVGFNIPTSIIPKWKSAPGNKGEDISKDLLDFTANGTKTLLFNAIELNKWGPNFSGNENNGKEKGKIGKFLEKVGDVLEKLGGESQPPATMKYTDEVTTTKEIEDSKEGEGDSLVDKLNKGVKNLVEGLIAGQESPTIPTESMNPGPPTNPIDGDEAYGFNKGYDVVDSKTLEEEYNNIDVQIGATEPKGKSDRFVVMNDENISIDAPLMSDANLFYWNKDRKRPVAKRGLLSYTQKLIKQGKGAKYIGIVNSDENITDDIDNPMKNTRHKIFSQGNRVKSEDNEVYCRSWSLRNPYSKYEDTIRHQKTNEFGETISSFESRQEIFSNLSVLEDNGMPKIVPYKTEYKNWTEGLHTDKSPSNYMLSIENLAWEGSREFNALPNIEKGPHGGRLMWFPPYDINFTDNSSVNWESTSFIGRAEPIYTYNNTERTGTLSFTIITDHPSSLNVIRKDTQINLEKYFAGCQDLKDTAFGDITNDEEIFEPELLEDPKPKEPPTGGPTLEFYFENADKKPKSSPGRSVYTDVQQGYEVYTENNFLEIEGLNEDFQDNLKKMVDFLLTENGKRFKIFSVGFTSALNTTDYNDVLGADRAKSLRDYLTSELIKVEQGGLEVNGTTDSVKYELGSVEGNKKTYPKEINWLNDTLRWAGPSTKGAVEGSGQSGPVAGGTTQEQKDSITNNPDAKSARRAVISLVYNPDIDAMMDKLATSEVESINEERKAKANRDKQQRQNTINSKAQKLANEMVNECTYFNKLEVDDPFIYDSLREKVEFFHPSFHSMTPEGLNSRLTFLKQCTRQGPNIAGKEPQNMAFGKPPICVLRIGDFYHTKIVIDTVNFTFEPLQWDLNASGIGVQPMIAKVDLNFKFIGGSSLGGPINELQNAVSYNFFANTSVYNRRKEVTTTDKEGLYNRVEDGKPITEEKFGYGSFITPEQVTGTDDPLQNIIKVNLDLTDTSGDEEIESTEKTTDDEQKKVTKDVQENEDGFDKRTNDIPEIAWKYENDLLTPTNGSHIVDGSGKIPEVVNCVQCKDGNCGSSSFILTVTVSGEKPWVYNSIQLSPDPQLASYSSPGTYEIDNMTEETPNQDGWTYNPGETAKFKITRNGVSEDDVLVKQYINTNTTVQETLYIKSNAHDIVFPADDNTNKIFYNWCWSKED